MRMCILFILVATISNGQELKPVQSVVRKVKDEIVIPFQKYVLSNGLTVVIHEDHSDPMVHVDVTYHVGSAREEFGKSGFAHFFEHMMFQGSDHVGDDQHFKIVTEAGGSLNGTTNRDRTNYFETVPSNQLERILWLEADRMGFLLDAVTQKKFENQRATVKNERAQRYDNRPYGLIGEVTARTLYPSDHPYSWPTIGYVEDLNRANLSDLKNFFLRWYGPNNATLTIGGDVDSKEVVKLVSKYFGSIPSGPKVVSQKVLIPDILSDRFVTLVDNHAALPQLTITFPTVPQYHPDMPALSCLAEILGYGKSAVFFQQLVKKKIAVNASASSTLYELSGEFSFSITPYTGVSLQEAYTGFLTALDSFETRGVTEDDVKKFKGTYESNLLNALQSVNGKVSQLAAFETFRGDPNMIGTLLEMNRKVTREDVLRVYKKYIQGKPSIILSVVPKTDPENVVQVENYSSSRPTRTLVDKSTAQLTYQKGKDTFDRSKMPSPQKNPLVTVPSFWEEEWKNGIQLIGHENNELPLVTISIKFPGGHIAQSADTSKAGLSRMLALMLNEDTEIRTAEAMQIELQKLGASISIVSSFDGIAFNVNALKKNLQQTLQLVEERIFRPSFTEEALSRHQQQTLESFKLRNAQPTFIADNVFAKLNYGRDNILGIDSYGTPWSVEHLTVRDVEQFYKDILTSRKTTVVVAGALNKTEALASFDFLKRLDGKEFGIPAIKDGPAIVKTRVFMVHVPGASQTQVRVGYFSGVKYDATGEFFKAGLMNYILGGAFSSRFNLNLREDKGWTYAARSAIVGDKYTGIFVFSTSVKSEATDSTIVEILKEMENYKVNELTAEELIFLRNAISQREALRYETLPLKAAFLKRILEYDLPPDHVIKQAEILTNITAKELNALAKKWLDTSRMNILLVGDRVKIRNRLERLNFEIVEVEEY